jgi:hypothetical protein
MVKDLNPTDSSLFGSDMINFSGALLFSADNGILGKELWSENTADTTAPNVLNWSFDPTRNLTFTINMSEAIDAATVQATDLTATQLLSTGSTVNFVPTSVQQSADRGTLTFTLPALPDGNYLFRLNTNSVSDDAGIPLVGAVIIEDATTFVLAGDANRDRSVDVSDLGILATNWQRTGKNFGEADFNYDGVVDVSDLGILATNWQKSLPPLTIGMSRAPANAAMRVNARHSVAQDLLSTETEFQ